MAEPKNSRGAGWTVLKVLGMVVALLGMAGFGLAGMCGLMIASLAGGERQMLALGLLGVAIAVACGILFAAILRSLGRKKR